MHVIHLQLLYLFAGGKYGLKKKKHLTQHLEIYASLGSHLHVKELNFKTSLIKKNHHIRSTEVQQNKSRKRVQTHTNLID